MRKLIIGVAAVLVLLLVVDRAALWGVGRLLDGRIEKELGAPVDTSVSGFPFLPSALLRTLPAVDLEAGKLALGSADLTVDSLDAHLTDVHVPSPSEATAGGFQATAVVPYTEVERRGDLPAGSLSGTAEGLLSLRQNVDILGRSLSVVVTGRPKLAGDTVTVEPVDIALGSGDVQLSEQSRRDLEERLQVQLPLDDLPQGTMLSNLEPRPEGLVLTLTGQNVPLSQL